MMNLTVWLAVYGAVLSTAMFTWSIFRARSTARLEIVDSFEGNLHGVMIAIQNRTQNKIHINDISFVYPYRNRSALLLLKESIKFKRFSGKFGWCHSSFSNFGLDSDLPISIEPHKSHLVFVPENILAEILRKSVRHEFKIVIQDALWRNRYSKKFRYRFSSSVFSPLVIKVDRP